MKGGLQRWAALASMRTCPIGTREEILARRDRRLRSVIAHAYRNVPYYRRLMDRHHVRPGDIRSAGDLQAIPVTSKADLRSVPVSDVVSEGVDPERLLTFKTSGSTGEPFTTRRSPWEERVLRSLRVRAMKGMGLRFSDRIALVADVKPKGPRLQPLLLRFLSALDPRRRTQVGCRLPLDEILRRLAEFRPDVIIGYSGLLARLAGELMRTGVRPIRPRFVQADSEVLTPAMRRQIRDGFCARVFEIYDSFEFNMLAWECGSTGELHVCDDGIVLEVLKDGRPCGEGERGEVVATGLHSYAMPFIRYRLGDLVTQGAETCRCGHPYSTIRSVQGRMIDFFPLPDGRLLHPYDIVNMLHDAAGWLGQYQLMQERTDRIVLRIVPFAPPPPEGVAGLEACVKSLLGPKVEFAVLAVPGIDIESSGKCRVSRSLVNSAYDGIRWE